MIVKLKSAFGFGVTQIRWPCKVVVASQSRLLPRPRATCAQVRTWLRLHGPISHPPDRSKPLNPFVAPGASLDARLELTNLDWSNVDSDPQRRMAGATVESHLGSLPGFSPLTSYSVAKRVAKRGSKWRIQGSAKRDSPHIQHSSLFPHRRLTSWHQHSLV